MLQRSFHSVSGSSPCLCPLPAAYRSRCSRHRKYRSLGRGIRQSGRLPLFVPRAVWQSADSELEAIRLKQCDADDRKWMQRLWATVDVTATLGSVCGAVAFIILEEAWLMGLPVILPLIALFANRQREKVSLQASFGSPSWSACSCESHRQAGFAACHRTRYPQMQLHLQASVSLHARAQVLMSSFVTANIMSRSM